MVLAGLSSVRARAEGFRRSIVSRILRPRAGRGCPVLPEDYRPRYAPAHLTRAPACSAVHNQAHAARSPPPAGRNGPAVARSAVGNTPEACRTTCGNRPDQTLRRADGGPMKPCKPRLAIASARNPHRRTGDWLLAGFGVMPIEKSFVLPYQHGLLLEDAIGNGRRGSDRPAAARGADRAVTIFTVSSAIFILALVIVIVAVMRRCRHPARSRCESNGCERCPSAQRTRVRQARDRNIEFLHSNFQRAWKSLRPHCAIIM